MVFSELPDMSDASHEFLQQYQKEKEQVMPHIYTHFHISLMVAYVVRMVGMAGMEITLLRVGNQ